MFLTALPCTAQTYQLVVDPGSNPAHAGTWKVDVSYNSASGLTSFTVVSGTGGDFQNTWDGWTWTVPSTTSDHTVTFNGTSNPPTDKSGKPQNPSNALEFTGATLDTQTGELKITNIKNDGGTFPIKSATIVPPPGDPKDGKAASSTIPKDKTLTFNSVAQTLSITSSTIVGLPDLGDPLFGANVDYPTFALTGLNPEADAYIFINQDLGTALTLRNTTTVFQTSTVSALYYNLQMNLFYGVSFHNTFDSSGSPFIDYVSSVLDPTTSLYDPLATYYVEIQPDINLFAMTQGWQQSITTGATDSHFLNGAPEPPPFGTIGAALVLGSIISMRRLSVDRSDRKPRPDLVS
jgi:hypothetical protein